MPSWAFRSRNIDITRAGQFLNHPISGGLGWAIARRAWRAAGRPLSLTVATVGDGSYMFANPVACHQIAEALELPLLTIVFNNGIWNAVKRSTLDVFPDGFAAKSNLMPITSLQPCRISAKSQKQAVALRSASRTAQICLRR